MQGLQGHPCYFALISPPIVPVAADVVVMSSPVLGSSHVKVMFSSASVGRPKARVIAWVNSLYPCRYQK